MWSKTLLLKNNFHSQHDTKLFNECYLSYHLYLLDGHLKDTTLYKKKKYYSFIKIYGELGADTATLHCCFVIDGGHYITEDTYQSIISDFC